MKAKTWTKSSTDKMFVFHLFTRCLSRALTRTLWLTKAQLRDTGLTKESLQLQQTGYITRNCFRSLIPEKVSGLRWLAGNVPGNATCARGCELGELRLFSTESSKPDLTRVLQQMRVGRSGLGMPLLEWVHSLWRAGERHREVTWHHSLPYSAMFGFFFLPGVWAVNA